MIRDLLFRLFAPTTASVTKSFTRAIGDLDRIAEREDAASVAGYVQIERIKGEIAEHDAEFDRALKIRNRLSALVA